MLPKLYLCGGIFQLSDSDATDWREHVKERIGETGSMPLFECVDPMRRDYRGREGEPGIDEEIVVGDLEDINECSALIVNATKPSWGTAMEALFAAREAANYGLRKEHIVAFGGVGPWSPWLTYHCTMTQTVDHAIARLITVAHELFVSVNP